MFASIVPLGITYFLLFWPPAGLGQFGLFVWLTVFAVASRTALTLFHVPYLALGAEMTQDYQERSQIAAIRQAVGMAGSLVVVMATWNLIMVATPESPTPQLTRAPYLDFAIATALAMTLLMAISTAGTLSLLPHLNQAKPDHPRFSLRRVYADIFDALRNQSFFALFWGSLIFAVFMGVHSSLAMHTKTFFWALDTSAIAYIQYAGLAGGITGLAALGTFHRRFDKRATLLFGVFAFTTTATLPVAFQLLGLMPDSRDATAVILIAAQFIGFAGIIHAAVSGVSMMGDIADEHELKHGRRQEGVYFGSHNFALKCTTALGSLLAGLALELVSFPTNATPGTISAAVLFNFGLVSIALVIMAVVGVWVFWPYDLSRERHARIRAALDARARSAAREDSLQANGGGR